VKYLLDTNTCIVYLAGRSVALEQHLLAQSDADIVVCAPVKAELYFGAARSRDPLTARTRQDAFLSRFTSLPFDDVAADAYGRIRADLANRGTPIGPNDLLIAAIGLAHNLIVITHNTAEFERVAGLAVEDWELP
jgi:tRNA(fMet)-specific endonuclease VapC